MSFLDEYERIDDMRSIAAMKRELALLDAPTRRMVIAYALKKSACQFTWSFFADLFKVTIM